MRCCGQKKVIEVLGKEYCKKHFIAYFEKNVFQTIRKFELIKKGDVVGVGVSGGKDSLAVLSLLHEHCAQRKIPLKAISINEGIHDYRDKSLADAEKFCIEKSIEWHKTSYEEAFGATLDEMMKRTGRKPCTVCGVFRRYLLNRKARDLGCTKLATGHNLDDEAQSIIMNQCKGNMGMSARLGPIVGVSRHSHFVQRIKPLYFLTERECRAYCLLKGIKVTFDMCPNINKAYRADVRNVLNALESRHPGTKQAIVNGLLEILPVLKEKYSDSTPASCSACGEASAYGSLCKACQFREELSLTNV